MPKYINPETAYDLERFTNEAIVKGPIRLSPMTGEAFLRMLEAVKGEPAAPTVSDDTVAKLQEQLLAGQAAGDKAAKEWAEKVARLESDLAAAKTSVPDQATVDVIEAPLKVQIASLEDIAAGYKLAAERDKAALEALTQETTDQGNIVRALEEKVAAAEAASKADADKIATLEAKVKALAAV